jgi:3alpha(or 20beta)-hydroxysteroid dehydrogenase
MSSSSSPIDLLSTLVEDYTTESRRFHGLVCAVTGGSTGIGSGCVRQLVAEGGKVVIFDILDDEGLALSKELGESNVIYSHCDITSEIGVEEAFQSALKRMNVEAFDVLICMAANFVYKEVHLATHEDWDRALHVNIKGTATTIKAVIPNMRKKGKGVIVVTSSITGTLAFPGFVPYSATKAAIIQMTRDISLDNGCYGIRINCVAPGPIFTNGGTVQHAKNSNIPLLEMCESLSKDVALRRMGRIKEVAKTVAFLASDDSSYITGSTIQCDGGFFRK